MSKIIEIGIAKESNKEIEKVKFIEVVAGKGINGDRYFVHDIGLFGIVSTRHFNDARN